MRTKAIALACTALLAFATPTGADPGERDHDAIQAVAQTALDARGTEQQEAAYAALYDIVADPVTRDACRAYADLMWVGLLLLDIAEDHPDSQAVGVLFGFVMDYAPIAKTDCLLAV